MEVDYRRMGHREHHIVGNAGTSTNVLHQLKDLWNSPRGTVLRIEALALAAIALSFLVVAFGSCRRWSNSWIVQKGFLAANVLSVSLGTYSIGLMQSSSVRSEMYPIWAVSLFNFLPCVDPVTSCISLDYMSPLSKIVFQICLYFGYVLLMSISTISGDNINIAICLLSAITFIKGFHRSLALVLPSRLREILGYLEDGVESSCFSAIINKGPHFSERLIVDFTALLNVSVSDTVGRHNLVTMYDILSFWGPKNDGLPSRQTDDSTKDKRENDEIYFLDFSMAFSLSHLLQRHFNGLSKIKSNLSFFTFGVAVDYRRAFKMIEVELAFVYETFFTSNAFIHYYEAKAASLWTFASFIGICFLGVQVAVSGTVTRRSATPVTSAGTIAVDSTAADLIVTLIILVSLALLQLVLLIRCWTSNWSRVHVACEFLRTIRGLKNWCLCWRVTWTVLKLYLVARVNWFDKWLWQEKLGQYSVVEGSIMGEIGTCWIGIKYSVDTLLSWVRCVYQKCARFLSMLGLQYIGQVFRELWGSRAKVGASVRLQDDVKAYFGNFLSQLRSQRIGRSWAYMFVANGVDGEALFYSPSYKENTTYQTACLLQWHIATCYCELAEREEQEGSMGNAAGTVCFKKAAACFSSKQKDDAEGGEAETNRRVAIALSKYYAYLVVSAPELLPGSSAQTKDAHNYLASEARSALAETKDKLEAMKTFGYGADLGRQLFDKTPGYGGRRCSDHWEVLAHFWVQAFVYIAPYGNTEAHMQHLSRGGEFITHLWALLYHLGVYKWEPANPEEFNKSWETKIKAGRRRSL